MALHGKLVLNGADYAPFNLYGVSVFMAFSGNGIYRNKGACGAVKGDGPLPPGKYWIVERGVPMTSFQEERQKFRTHGIKFTTAQHLDVMNGLPYTKMIGALMMALGWMVSIVDYSGCIRGKYQRDA